MEHFARLREYRYDFLHFRRGFFRECHTKPDREACHLRFELRLIPETLGFAFAHLHGAIVKRNIDSETCTFVGLTFCAHPSAMAIGNLFYD